MARLAPDAPVPDWATAARDFFSVTRTADELSILCPASKVPADVRVESEWCLFKLHGPFSFAAVGVLASIVTPLANAGLAIIVTSTFDTDYILVKSGNEHAARQTLVVAGHTFVTDH
jgi:hypothetical protein